MCALWSLLSKSNLLLLAAVNDGTLCDENSVGRHFGHALWGNGPPPLLLCAYSMMNEAVSEGCRVVGTSYLEVKSLCPFLQIDTCSIIGFFSEAYFFRYIQVVVVVTHTLLTSWVHGWVAASKGR